MSEGVLILAATPLGDPADASARLRDLLEHAEVVAAEDTRRARGLATRLGVAIGGELISLHDHNEAERVPLLLRHLRAGEQVVVISDAGMPGVSDPGYRLVRAAIEEGVRVTCAPGPSAALAALVVSGLPMDRFAFEGFLPRRPGERDRRARSLAAEERTLVFYESPRRLAETLAALAAACGGQRPAAVCRELTKTHEEVRRGSLEELADWAKGGVRGEIVIVVGPGAPEVDLDKLADEAAARVAAGERLREVCADLGRQFGVPSRDLYRLALTRRP